MLSAERKRDGADFLASLSKNREVLEVSWAYRVYASSTSGDLGRLLCRLYLLALKSSASDSRRCSQVHTPWLLKGSMGKWNECPHTEAMASLSSHVLARVHWKVQLHEPALLC